MQPTERVHYVRIKNPDISTIMLYTAESSHLDIIDGESKSITLNFFFFYKILRDIKKEYDDTRAKTSMALAGRTIFLLYLYSL